MKIVVAQFSSDELKKLLGGAFFDFLGSADVRRFVENAALQMECQPLTPRDFVEELRKQLQIHVESGGLQPEVAGRLYRYLQWKLPSKFVPSHRIPRTYKREVERIVASYPFNPEKGAKR